MNIEEKLDHLSDFLKIRIDIISHDTKRWLDTSAYYQLPTFEEYLQKCIIDKGESYDFTIRRWKTATQTLKPITYAFHINRNTECKKLKRYLIYSDWMGSPFNFKEVIEYE